MKSVIVNYTRDLSQGTLAHLCVFAYVPGGFVDQANLSILFFSFYSFSCQENVDVKRVGSQTTALSTLASLRKCWACPDGAYVTPRPVTVTRHWCTGNALQAQTHSRASSHTSM